jgi:hypothetical protein
MRGSQSLIPLLVAASATLSCAALSYAAGVGVAGAWSTRQPPETALLLVWALQRSHLSLITVWLVLGGGRSWLRAIVVVLVVVAWCFALVLFTEEPLGSCLFRLSVHVAALAVMLASAWSIGLRLVGAVGQFLRTRAESQRARWQFSIGSMLGWTAAVALVTGVWRFVYARDGPSLDYPLAWYPWSRALIAVVSLWFVFGRRFFAARLTAALTVACLIVALAYFTGDYWTWREYGQSAAFLGAFATLVGLESALLTAALWVVRMAGYRLIWV